MTDQTSHLTAYYSLRELLSATLIVIGRVREAEGDDSFLHVIADAEDHVAAARDKLLRAGVIEE